MLYKRGDLKYGHIHLSAHQSPKSSAPIGIKNLKLNSDRDAIIYVPKSYCPEVPSPFALMLHGAGGSSEHGLFLLKHLAEENNLILLATSSRSSSWDIINDGVFDLDVLFIIQAMEEVFGSYAIDYRRLAIGGFSDGASYALSLGLINGELFTHIIAFSPGFFHAPFVKGKPKVFVSHGVKDNVLPINSCSRRIVPKLKKEGYNVTYHEFGDGHIIPETISKEAVKWFL